MHYFHQNWLWCTENTPSLASAVLCRCFTTPSRVYKLLNILRCLSVGGSESCIYAGFTRCWVNYWTDDRLSQQLRRQFHSPTLSRRQPRFFSACFVYICLSLSCCLFLTHTILTFLTFSWHILQSLSFTHTLFLVFLNTDHHVQLQIIVSELQCNQRKCCIRSWVIVGEGNKPWEVIYFRGSNKH